MPSWSVAMPSSIARAQHALGDHPAGSRARRAASGARARAHPVPRAGPGRRRAMLRTPTTTSRSDRAGARRAPGTACRSPDGRGPRGPARRRRRRGPSHGRSIRSTSAPLAVSSSASSSADRSTGQHSSSHERTILMRRPRTARGTERRPRRTTACRGCRTGAWRRARSRGRTRTPCIARCRIRSSPAPSDGPCRHRAARSSRCRTSGNRRPSQMKQRHRDLRPRARRTGSTSGSRRDLRSPPNIALGERLQRALQVGERDPLVDREPLDLVEHRQVGRVGRLPAVDAARQRRCRRAAAASPSCGSARPTSRCAAAVACPGIVDVERVLHRAGGMIGRDVERLEVVPVVLDLGSLAPRGSPAG